MKDGFLLKSPLADRLYGTAATLPIIDYHNHLSVDELARDTRYENITDLWITSDPYKHRLMRMSGIPEQVITGECDPRARFAAYCRAFPYLCGTAVYDFSVLELHSIFGIDEIPSAENADRLYDRLSEMLASPEYTSRALLRRFGVEYQSPVATIDADVSGYTEGLAPSLRGDSLLTPEAGAATSLDAYIDGIEKNLDRLCGAGCRFADHSLDDGFAYLADDGRNAERFAMLSESPASLTSADRYALSSEILRRLAPLYADRRITLLLHLGAKRQTSDRLRRLAGPAGGYAAIGSTPTPTEVCNMLGDFERVGGLPSTVLFPLNMSQMPALAVIGGSFSEDGVAGKVQLGPAWWWCDHTYGIGATLDAQRSFGLLSEFIGMTTDSRSILSFARHDYFRRIFCSYLADLAEGGHAPSDEAFLTEVVRKVCYANAKARI